MDHSQSALMDGPRRPSGSTLYLKVLDEHGERPEGNVFVALRREDTGEEQRTLAWHAPSRSFRFQGLGPGAVTYRIWRSTDCVTAGRLDLPDGDLSHEVQLPPIARREPLVLPVASRLAAWRSCLRPEPGRPPDLAAADRRLPAQGASRLLCGLMADGHLVAAMTQPLTVLGFGPELQRFIETTMQPGQGPMAAAYRARFLMITLRAGLNPTLRAALAPDAGDAEIWASVLGVVATLDDADLDDLLVWTARLHQPRTALFEQFARAWADRFNGLQNLRTHAPYRKDAAERATESRPPMPRPPAPVVDPALQSLSAPAMADIAHIAHALRSRS